MKRRELVRLLEAEGCFVTREGGRHSIYKNPLTGKKCAVPRHAEVKKYVAKTILCHLDVPLPPSLD